MIGPIVRTGILTLARSRADLLLTFLIPIAFFSLFTLMFERGVGPVRELALGLADADGGAASSALVARLEAREEIDLVRTGNRARDVPAREQASELIRKGRANAALVIPRGWPEDAPLDLLIDSADPLAGRLLAGLLVQDLSALRNAAPAAPHTDLDETLRIVDLLADDKTNPVVAMHAAGIAVMFLLFGAVGAAGALIDEEESGTLERILTTRVGMTSLLLGKWCFLTMLGVVQVSAMFAYGEIAFGADLSGHLLGFLVMTLVTAMASSSLALVLAAACRSRSQLNGVAVIVILCMSALGGSMIPRYVMSEEMQRLGLLTFNGWALDGYTKVFWLERPLVELAPQVAVLLASALVFFGIARLLARRWEQI